MTTTARPPSSVVEQVSDTVHRIELPLPFDDLHIVNGYVILGATGATLVDPGWSDEACETTLLAALRGLGVSRGDVRRTLVTHAHPDHYTLAFAWQRDHRIPIHLGADERPSVVAFSPSSARFPRQAELLVRAGDPALAAVIRDLELLDYEREMSFGLPQHWLSDQQVIDCDGEEVVVHATPGHTRGHVVFEHRATGDLFTGDHLLPRITPSIGLELDPEDRPLAHYLQSLDLLLRREDARMLPAHGPITVSVHNRARELLIHHDHRLAVITGLVRSGLDTAALIAAAMTWTRHERTLTEFNDVHRMTATVEVLSHLDLLADRGDITRSASAGVDRFTG